MLKSLKSSRVSIDSQSGFTLLEILIALMIMTLSFTSILSIESGSIQSTTRSKQMNIVGMLARNQMVETEYKIQGKPFLEMKTEESGTFPAPYQDYRWKTTIKDVNFPSISSLFGNQKKEGEGSDQNRSARSSILEGASSSLGGPAGAELATQAITKAFSKAMKQVNVTVLWKTGSKEQSFTLSTFWVDFNYELGLGGL